MSLTRALAHSTLIQLGGKLVSTLLGLAAIALMTRYLGVEQFGWYVTATGFLQFVGLVADGGFTITTSALLAEPTFDRRRVLNTCFSWRLISATVFQGAAPLLILAFPYPKEVKQAVAILTLAFFAIALSQVFIGYFREQLKLKIVMGAEILGRLLLLLGIAFSLVARQQFTAIMVAVTVAALGSALILAYCARPLRFCFDRSISRALWHKMWPTALAVVATAVYLQGDRVILPLFADQTTVGLYGASYRIVEVVIQLAAMIMGTVMPLVAHAWSRHLTAEFQRRAQLGFDLINLLLWPAVAGLIAIAPGVLTFVAGKEFAPGAWMLQGLSLSLLGVAGGMIFGHYALAIGRQTTALLIYGSDALLSLIGYFIFIPRYGVAGAIGVTIGSELYAGAGLALLCARASGWRPRLTTLLKIILASGAMGGAIYALQPLPLILSLGLGGLLYGLLALLLRTISPATLREVFAPAAIAPPNNA
ncbi:MAG: oligosaccharide flippase family protein [Candidatus Magasanikbacteria bacterium]|nr:oligosaccharide flippase family protein [Candidatus Magasanikbacteria bacterium]